MISGALFIIRVVNHRLINPHCIVLQEAYNSRYRNALHVGAFDKAVKRYRQKFDQARPAGRKRHRLHIRRHGDPPSTSHSSLNLHDHAGAPSRTPTQRIQTATHELHARAQERLEALPDHVLNHVKLFHRFIRFFVEGGHILHGHDEEVSDRLRGLLDEIAALGGIGKVTKDELLQDEDTRHVSVVIFDWCSITNCYVSVDIIYAQYREYVIIPVSSP